MSKVFVIFAAVLAISHATVVVPPSCDEGAGSGVSILTYVTNLTASATELTSTQPYNLTAGATYNVTFAFIPTANTSAAQFTVIGIFTVNGVPHEQEIASTEVGAYSATTVTTMLSYLTVIQVIELVIKCGVQTAAQLLNKTYLEALNCAGDTLAGQIATQVPSQASATVLIEVPTLSNGTATFKGIVQDDEDIVLCCKQGIVRIIG